MTRFGRAKLGGAARSVGIFVAVQTVLASTAIACGFDGLLGDKFSAQHAKSLSVAFAISDSVASGAIGKGALAPIDASQRGYWQAMTRLQQFSWRLSGPSVTTAKLPPVSILLIDSRLWTRLRPESSGYAIEAHATGPAAGDVAIVTNEFVLAALIDGKLNVRLALETGVVALDGDAALATTVRNQMIAHFSLGKAVPERQTAPKFLPPWGSARPSANLP